MSKYYNKFNYSKLVQSPFKKHWNIATIFNLINFKICSHLNVIDRNLQEK